MNKNTKLFSAKIYLLLFNTLSRNYLSGFCSLIRADLETVVKNRMFWLQSVSNPGQLEPTVPGQITPGNRIC